MKLIALIAGVLALGTSLNIRPQEERHEQIPSEAARIYAATMFPGY